MLEKPKLSFDIGSITIKANIELSEKETKRIPQKRFQGHFCLYGHLGIDDGDFTFFVQCETHKQLKEREAFW